MTAAIDYRKSFSEKYAASTNSAGYVRITDSIYTAANKSALMTFSDITENSSAELRSVVNGAIGVNNVIALGECRQNGITKPETLVECIEYYYTNRCCFRADEALRNKHARRTALLRRRSDRCKHFRYGACDKQQ